MMQLAETPERQSRPTILLSPLAILVGFGIVSSVATGCSPAGPSPTTTPSSIARTSPSSSPTLPYSGLQGVTCAGGNDCWAVGLTGIPGIAATHTLIEHYAGSSWAIVSTPNPIEGALREVTCVSAADCWAVGSTLDQQAVGGSTPDTQAAQPLVEQYTRRGWAIVSTPNCGPGQLNGVTCAGAGGCWAVGSLLATGSPPLIERDTGSGWAISTPDPSPGDLVAVTCSSARDCWAVGTSGKPLIEHYTGGSWSIASTATPIRRSAPARASWME